jgi:hypothetical protein
LPYYLATLADMQQMSFPPPCPWWNNCNLSASTTFVGYYMKGMKINLGTKQRSAWKPLLLVTKESNRVKYSTRFAW